MYKSHAELEQEHYKALANSTYRTDGMMDVIREEVMMSMPLQSSSTPSTTSTDIDKALTSISGDLQLIKGHLAYLTKQKDKTPTKHEVDTAGQSYRDVK